jgi:hypothetical protein
MFVHVKQATVLALLLVLVATACGEQKAVRAMDAGVDASPVPDTLPETKPRSDLPRPMEWALGTWVGTVPAEVSPGVASQLSGRTVRVEITGVGRRFETSDSRGCFYVGSLIWEPGGQDESTAPLDDLTGTNAGWVYYPQRRVEEFSVNGEFGVGYHVSLHTQDLGPPDANPTELRVAWNIESSPIVENNGGNPATCMLLRKK